MTAFLPHLPAIVPPRLTERHQPPHKAHTRALFLRIAAVESHRLRVHFSTLSVSRHFLPAIRFYALPAAVQRLA
jgi:hypothetical protein